MINKPIQKNWNEYSNFPNFIAEPKLDGMRIQLTITDKVQLLRENGLDKTKQFPEVHAEAIKQVFPEDTIFDGELCILNDNDQYTANFFKLQTRQTQDLMRIGLLSKKIPATFMAFDILKYNGENLRHKKLSERKEILDNAINNHKNSRIEIIEYFDEPKELLELQQTRIELSEDELDQVMEGIVLKDPNADYNTKWLKFKQYKENDFKVVGFTSETKMISALKLENSKGENVGRVNYTGYPQTKEWQNKVIGMTAVVLHMTTNKGKVRFPILKELR